MTRGSGEEQKMDESGKARSVLYITANDALSYARRCCDHDDQEGEAMALKHAVELILDLLEVKVLAVDSEELAKLGQPAEDGGGRGPSGHFEMPARTGAVAPSQGTGTIGHNPKGSALKKFELSRKDADTGEFAPFAKGTAAELAPKAGVKPGAIYKQAQTGRAFGNGMWKVRHL